MAGNKTFKILAAVSLVAVVLIFKAQADDSGNNNSLNNCLVSIGQLEPIVANGNNNNLLNSIGIVSSAVNNCSTTAAALDQTLNNGNLSWLISDVSAVTSNLDTCTNAVGGLDPILKSGKPEDVLANFNLVADTVNGCKGTALALDEVLNQGNLSQFINQATSTVNDTEQCRKAAFDLNQALSGENPAADPLNFLSQYGDTITGVVNSCQNIVLDADELLNNSKYSGYINQSVVAVNSVNSCRRDVDRLLTVSNIKSGDLSKINILDLLKESSTIEAAVNDCQDAVNDIMAIINGVNNISNSLNGNINFNYNGNDNYDNGYDNNYDYNTNTTGRFNQTITGTVTSNSVSSAGGSGETCNEFLVTRTDSACSSSEYDYNGSSLTAGSGVTDGGSWQGIIESGKLHRCLKISSLATQSAALLDCKTKAENYEKHLNGDTAVTGPYPDDFYCKAHFDSTNQLISYELRNSAFVIPGNVNGDSQQVIDRCVFTKLRYQCDHEDDYRYDFLYQIFQNQNWVNIADTAAHKCENVRLSFSPSAEWFASLTKKLPEPGIIPLFDSSASPPTSLLACSDQSSCLGNTTEYQLTTETWGKGVQKVPANFIENTQNSLSGSDGNVRCSNGACTAYSGGEHIFSATVPANSYFGQCRGYDQTLNNPEAIIPAATSSFRLNILNRPPVANLSFAKNPISIGEETQVTCDIVDPDDCSDKIAKVKWNCFNSSGQQTNCFFLGSSGVWQQGAVTEDISSDKMANPYRATMTFKGIQAGGYAVTCEAFDNDANNPSSGLGAGTIGVTSSNEDENNGGEIAANMKFCTVLTDEGSNKNVCSTAGKVELQAYHSGMEPDKFEWKCSSSDNAHLGTNVEDCNYPQEGTYSPALRVHDSESNEWINCTSQAKVKVTSKKTCLMGVRKAGSNNEFTKELQVNAGDEIEAKVDRECLNSGEVSWNIGNADKVSEEKDQGAIRLKYNTAGGYNLGANIGNISCGGATLTVNNKVKWGQ